MLVQEDKIFNIKKAKYYLPHYPVDSISNIIVSTQNYWDNWEGGALGIIDKYLPDNAVILDIGANIGSHTLYWALERNAAKIYAFEPLLDTFEILKTNVELNNLEDRVQIYNAGLSDELCFTGVSSYNERNIGGTSFKKAPVGEYLFCPLDDFKFMEHIDLIKIDVEGAELEVLNGGRKTIMKDNPVIVLETFTHKKEVDAFMSSISYEQVATIREGEDYIYQYGL